MSVICGLYDVIAGHYLFVVQKESENVAKRDFISDYVAGRLDGIEKVKEYPNHYRIDVISNFEPDSGLLDPIVPRTLLELSTCVSSDGKKELIEV